MKCGSGESHRSMHCANVEQGREFADKQRAQAAPPQRQLTKAAPLQCQRIYRRPAKTKTIASARVWRSRTLSLLPCAHTHA